jgi:hypothetical protein
MRPGASKGFEQARLLGWKWATWEQTVLDFRNLFAPRVVAAAKARLETWQ